METTTKDKDRAEDQALAQFESIKELIERLREAQKAENDTEEEKVMEEIQNDPLSVEVRASWHTPGSTGDPDEYQILLCTGGPAVCIRGELDDFQPRTAELFYQDWFTSWEGYPLDDDQEDFLRAYAEQFYYGG